jgi:hypothetical protein
VTLTVQFRRLPRKIEAVLASLIDALCAQYPQFRVLPMSLPQFMQYVNPLLATLRKLGGVGRPQQVFQSIAREMSLSPNLLAERLGSGGSRFENQVAWARWYLANAGFIDDSRRGIWKLTEKAWTAEFLSEEALKRIFNETHGKYRTGNAESDLEVPETSAEVFDIEKLKQLYRTDKVAQFFLEHAAGRQRNQSETTVDRAIQILRNDGNDVSRQQLISTFQQLEECGCGQFVAGRRGFQSRFVWSTAMISVGRAATGEQEEIEELSDTASPAETKNDWITHSFHLRPGLTLELDFPADLTTDEAIRISRFVRSLPFGDA